MALRATLGRFDSVLGVLEKEEEVLDPEIQERIARRTRARDAGNYAEADRMRDELATMGIVLEDTPQGVRWKRKPHEPAPDSGT